MMQFEDISSRIQKNILNMAVLGIMIFVAYKVHVAQQQQVNAIKADTEIPNDSNVLTQIQFGTPTNATIQMIGQSSIGTSPINLPTGTRQLVVIVSQTSPAAAFHVPFRITDSCGGVDKFVGGGANSIAN